MNNAWKNWPLAVNIKEKQELLYEQGGLHLIRDDKLIQLAADACEDEKAIGITVLDVSEQTIIAEYFVIASGRSIVQVKSIVEHVEEVLEKNGIKPLRRAGQNEGLWIVLDYGFFMLHVFRQQEREYYNLENLWADAKEISFEYAE